MQQLGGNRVQARTVAIGFDPGASRLRRCEQTFFFFAICIVFVTCRALGLKLLLTSQRLRFFLGIGCFRSATEFFAGDAIGLFLIPATLFFFVTNACFLEHLGA